MRNRVRLAFSQAFQAPGHLLDLGCGTGEDALWLATKGFRVTGVDRSGAMLRVAETKLAKAAPTSAVRFVQADLALTVREPGRLENLVVEPITGALSNFGFLNCITARGALVRALADLLRPGSFLVVVVMGRYCPWEIVTNAVTGRFEIAFRRLGPSPVAKIEAGPTFRLDYPTPGTLRREFAPFFEVRHLVGLGILLPPTEQSQWVERIPRLFRCLRTLEGSIESTFPSPWLADHYLVVFERTSKHDSE